MDQEAATAAAAVEREQSDIAYSPAAIEQAEGEHDNDQEQQEGTEVTPIHIQVTTHHCDEMQKECLEIIQESRKSTKSSRLLHLFSKLEVAIHHWSSVCRSMDEHQGQVLGRHHMIGNVEEGQEHSASSGEMSQHHKVAQWAAYGQPLQVTHVTQTSSGQYQITYAPDQHYVATTTSGPISGIEALTFAGDVQQVFSEAIAAREERGWATEEGGGSARKNAEEGEHMEQSDAVDQIELSTVNGLIAAAQESEDSSPSRTTRRRRLITPSKAKKNSLTPENLRPVEELVEEAKRHLGDSEAHMLKYGSEKMEAMIQDAVRGKIKAFIDSGMVKRENPHINTSIKQETSGTGVGGSGGFICGEPDCNKAFGNQVSMLRHVLKFHFEDLKPQWCPHCEKKFYLRQELGDHIHVHTGEFRYFCDEPGCKFKTMKPYELREHQDNHRGIRRYSCPKCDRKFSTRQYLNAHLPTHNAKPLFKCPVVDCEKLFRSKNSLRSHKYKVHTNPASRLSEIITADGAHSLESDIVPMAAEVKLHACHLCEIKYKDRRSLKSHLAKVHEFPKPLPPDWKEKEAAKRKKIKEKIDPRLCSDCGKYFERPYDYTVHRYKRHPNKDFKCPEPGCGKVYKVRSSFQHHMKAHRKRNGTQSHHDDSSSRLEFESISSKEPSSSQKGASKDPPIILRAEPDGIQVEIARPEHLKAAPASPPRRRSTRKK